MSDTEVLHRVTTWEDGSEYHFASIDGGVYWLEIDRPPTQDDYGKIQELLEGTRDPNTGQITFPIKCANQYFATMDTKFTVGDIEVAAS